MLYPQRAGAEKGIMSKFSARRLLVRGAAISAMAIAGLGITLAPAHADTTNTAAHSLRVNGFHQPVNGFGSGVNGFDTGVNGFDSGVNGFNSSVNGFSAPVNGFSAPVNGFSVNGFSAPVNGFAVNGF